MPTTISISLASISGEAGPFTLFLRKTSDRSLVNAGGDALTEVEVDTVKTGVWTATVAETIPTEDCLARIYEGTSEAAAAILIDSILYEGQTEIGKEAAASGGLTPEESAQLNLIQSNTSSLSNLTASLPLSPGVIVGPSEPLVIGDDYTSAVGRQVRVNLLNSTGGSAVTTFGSKSLSDAGISIQLLLRKSGQVSAVAQLVGTCSFFPAETIDGVEIPPYLLVSFSRTETAKATPGAYDMQAEAVWSSGEVVTFAPYGQVEFVRNIQRVS